MALLRIHHSLREIAGILGRDHGTLSREVQRNRIERGCRAGIYDPTAAHRKAYLRRSHAKFPGKKIAEGSELHRYVADRLAQGYAPDVIAGRMKREEQPFSSSKNTIYRFCYSTLSQGLWRYLPAKRYRPKKRKRKKMRRILIPDRVSIAERPREVEERNTAGHFEGDEVLSGKHHHSRAALTVLSERMARYITAQKIPCLKPSVVTRARRRMCTRFQKIHTITLDNGIENRDHRELGVPTYFCDPYAAWQKAGVENSIQLLRRVVPKGCDIRTVRNRTLQQAVQRLNHTPRKSLGYKTPYEVMVEHGMLVVERNKKHRR